MYHNVGDRIAVNLKSLRVPIDCERIKRTLVQLGFSELSINLTLLARKLVGCSHYRRGAQPEEAPRVVDCSSMVKWIYGQAGIWLPRYSVDQRDNGRVVKQPREGDLVFTSGWRSYYWDDANDGVGHVGMVTSEGTVIHAASGRLGVTETPWEKFCGQLRGFRGLRRYLPSHPESLVVLQMGRRRVETSQELRWIILQNL